MKICKNGIDECISRKTGRRDSTGDVALDYEGWKDFKGSFSPAFYSVKRAISLTD